MIKDTHPWKASYKKNLTRASLAPQPKREKKEAKLFISEILDNWDNIEVLMTVYGKEGKHLLRTLPQDKQVIWFTGHLKNIYG